MIRVVTIAFAEGEQVPQAILLDSEGRPEHEATGETLGEAFENVGTYLDERTRHG